MGPYPEACLENQQEKLEWTTEAQDPLRGSAGVHVPSEGRKCGLVFGDA